MAESCDIISNIAQLKVGVNVLPIYLLMLDNEEERATAAKIYEEHKSAMLKYALSMIPNKEMAEDAVHCRKHCR